MHPPPGIDAATPDSDLDLILSMPQPISRPRAAELLNALPNVSVRIDVLMETPAGGVLMRDYASGASKLLLRTCVGPRLIEDPWAISSPTEIVMLVSEDAI